MNEYWWGNFKGGIGTWWYNLMTRVGGGAVRLFQITPRCSCGWRLAQRNDGTWLCCHCLHVAFPDSDPLKGRSVPKNWPCDCMFCNGLVRDAKSKNRWIA